MPNKMSPEERDAFIRKWVRALPTERSGLCKAAGISPQLPYYWRRENLFPKDVTAPPPAPKAAAPVTPPAPAKAPAPKVEPRSEMIRPYTIPERQIIHAEYAAARAAAKAGEADGPGVNRAGLAIVAKYGGSIRSWLYKKDSLKDDAKTRRRYTDEFKASAARAYDRSADKGATAAQLGVSMSVLMAWVKKGLAEKPPGAKAPAGKEDHHHWKPEDKDRLLAEFDRSGQSRADFCKAHGLARGTLGYWLALRESGQPHRGPGRPPKTEPKRTITRHKGTKALVATMNGALARANGHAPLAKTNGHYHPPGGKVIRSDDLMGALAETLRRLRARGTVITSMSTDAESGEVRVTTQTTETILI